MILLALVVSLVMLFLVYVLQNPNQPRRFLSIGWNGLMNNPVIFRLCDSTNRPNMK
jgi:hypothetical protein